jgi:hypothetical protein
MQTHEGRPRVNTDGITSIAVPLTSKKTAWSNG